ncbi:MAG: hypothetical protein QG553_780 [Patescibacteria group bacterium]|nr:hypothetical protein [Patescibacteria group bacterium]
MSRLPIPGSDKGTWGDILNDFLQQSLNADGSLKSDALPTDAVAATGSLRTLGTGSTQAAAGNHNHNDIYEPLLARTQNSQATDYILQLADATKEIVHSGSTDHTYTVPPQSSVTWPALTKIEIVNDGASILTIAPGSGVSITGDLRLYQGLSGTLERTGADTWRFKREGPTGWVPLWRQRLTSTQANFDITSIDQHYLHLRVVAKLRSDRASDIDAITMALNGDATNANYDRQLLDAVGTTASVSQLFGASGSRQIGAGTGANSPANHFSHVQIDLDYYTGSGFKIAEGRSRIWSARSASKFEKFDATVGWANTAAISQITLTPTAGTNWSAGSEVAVYGLIAPLV